MWKTRLRRAARSGSRTYREARAIALALRSPRHPVLAHVVVTRRCNLACTYCNEFDDFSKPVPTEEMLRRIDLLAALGTTAVTLTGGETLLHPDLEKIVARIRNRGMIAVMVTNGYLLTVDRIEKLNRAGLDRLQISIDNVMPDDVSKKSLKVLDQKLRWLSEHAAFEVNIHSVCGAGTEKPQDALAIAKRANELHLISTAGIVHDEKGQIQPLNPVQRKVLDDIDALRGSIFSFARYNPWRRNLIQGLPNEWHCTAGGRHLYICEDGLVHWCMAQRGYPAKPLAEYTVNDIERESKARKSCAPFCTIFCIQRVAFLDHLREHPREALARMFPSRTEEGAADLPIPVRVLRALLAPSNSRGKLLRKAALRVFGID